MRIVNSPAPRYDRQSNVVQFKHIKIGQVFLVNGDVVMRCEPCREGWHRCNAVSLMDGELYRSIPEDNHYELLPDGVFYTGLEK